MWPQHLWGGNQAAAQHPTLGMSMLLQLRSLLCSPAGPGCLSSWWGPCWGSLAPAPSPHAQLLQHTPPPCSDPSGHLSLCTLRSWGWSCHCHVPRWHDSVLTVDDCCGQDGCHAGLLGQELDVGVCGGRALGLCWLLLHRVAGGATGLGHHEEHAQQPACRHRLGDSAPEGFICRGGILGDGRALAVGGSPLPF